MTNIRTENPLGMESITPGIMSTFKSITQDVFNKHAYNKNTRITFVDGRKLRFESPVSDLLIIMNAAPPSANNTLNTHEQVILDTVGISTMMQGGHSAYTPYKDENGIDLAYYDKKYNDLYVPYNVLELEEATAFTFYERLLERIIADIQLKEAQQYMWGGENHTMVLSSLAELVKGQEHTNVRNLEDNLRASQRSEEEHRDQLRRSIVKTRNYMNQIAAIRESDNALDTRIGKEFDIVSKNPDVKYIEVRDGKFIIHTNPIIGFADNGKHYYFGNFRIEYTLGNTGVRYFGDTPRHGYWTEKDPHPHVDGGSGSPCLGNTGEAIAQLGSLHEYAALVTVAIEFLKAANTQDSAGRKVIKWDECDATTGEIKKKSGSRGHSDVETRVCYETGEEYPSSEMVRVYLEADDDDFWNEEWVHEDRVTENFTESSLHGVWVHDNAEVFQ